MSKLTGSGNISDKLVANTHTASFAHSTSFFSQYKGAKMLPLIVDTTLWGLESFPCQESYILIQSDFVRYLRWARQDSDLRPSD
jgi:hypothetical protein